MAWVRSMAWVRPVWGLCADFLEKRPLKLAEDQEKKVFYFFYLYRRFRPSPVSQTIELEKIYRFVSKILDFMPYGSVLSRFCALYDDR